MIIKPFPIALIFGLVLGSPISAQDQSNPPIEDRPTTGASQASIETAPDSGDGENQTIAVDPAIALKGIEAAIRELIVDENEIESKRQENRDKRHLKAQERVVILAEYMFYLGLATISLTFLVLLTIIKTLRQTQRAANATSEMLIEAKKTTAAALSANNIVRHGQRAWICFENFITHPHVNSVLDGERVPYFVVIKLSFMNRGNGPAFNTACHIQTKIAKKSEPVPTFQPAPPKDDFQMVAGPNQTIAFNAAYLKEEDLAEMKSDKSYLYIYALIKYDTQHSDIEGTSEICLRFTLTKKDKDENDNPRHQFDVTPIGSQNSFS